MPRELRRRGCGSEGAPASSSARLRVERGGGGGGVPPPSLDSLSPSLAALPCPPSRDDSSPSDDGSDAEDAEGEGDADDADSAYVLAGARARRPPTPAAGCLP